jgi:hypothetical protein
MDNENILAHRFEVMKIKHREFSPKIEEVTAFPPFFLVYLFVHEDK